MAILGKYGQEVASMGLGAAVTSAWLTTGEAPFSASLKVGASAAACLYGCLKIRSYLTRPQPIAVATTPKITATKGALLGAGAGVGLLALASILEKNALKNSGLLCLIPSVGYLGVSTLKPLFGAKKNQAPPELTKRLDPLQKRNILIATPKDEDIELPRPTKKENGMRSFSAEEMTRYNREKGNAFEVRTASALEEYTRDYANFPTQHASGGSASLVPQSAPTAGKQSLPLPRSGSSSSQEVTLVPQSEITPKTTLEKLNLVIFGIERYPIVIPEELEFDSHQAALTHLLKKIQEKESKQQEMFANFKRWVGSK
ncbi:hypothetical protein EB008_04200 [bacterium]|nr:hypothetical protein [bacterium]